MDSIQKPALVSCLKSAKDKQEVTEAAQAYNDYYGHLYTENKEREDPELEKKRKKAAADVASAYYDLVTDFYEYGWGESFHFAPINVGESREHAFTKHEYKLALKLGLKEGDTALDLGCGIGGPARHIATFSDAKVIGLNYNDYQLTRCKALTEKAKLGHLCSFVKGDFCDAPFPDESFSKVYAIEATCHAQDLAKVYGEAYRVLKPGGLFAFYEWIVTDKYDDGNTYHRQIKHGILEGGGLPDLYTPAVVKGALTKVGFEILEANDLMPKSPVPWYSVLQPQWTLSDLKITPLGQWFSHFMLMALETVGIAPKGSCKVHGVLIKESQALVLGGQTGIFSPMYLVVARKPQNAE